MAKFFVPVVDEAKQEEFYFAFAAMAGSEPHAPNRRICSITWHHDGVVWTAVVGEHLRGIETVVKGRGRQKQHLERPRHTSDTVLAIFSGAPFKVVHDNHSRYWNLPIYAGEPTRVEYFDAE